MNIAVRYYSRSGNTRRLADAAAAAVGVQACDLTVPLSEKADILFLGTSLYAGGVDSSVKSFIAANADKIGMIVSFGSSASGKSTFNKVKALAGEKGIKMAVESFNCPGKFLLLHTGRPNAADLKAIGEFAVSTAEKYR